SLFTFRPPIRTTTGRPTNRRLRDQRPPSPAPSEHSALDTFTTELLAKAEECSTVGSLGRGPSTLRAFSPSPSPPGVGSSTASSETTNPCGSGAREKIDKNEAVMVQDEEEEEEEEEEGSEDQFDVVVDLCSDDEEEEEEDSNNRLGRRVDSSDGVDFEIIGVRQFSRQILG
ncbi:hypothetical protein HC762_00805, partial [bacterium]|nr:hypothetical protein [bacterium]